MLNCVYDTPPPKFTVIDGDVKICVYQCTESVPGEAAGRGVCAAFVHPCLACWSRCSETTLMILSSDPSASC